MRVETTAWGNSRLPRADFLAVTFIAVACLFTFARCLFVDNSVVFHDEYVYRISADATIDQHDVLGRGLASPIPNRLYLAVYGLASALGSNFYVGAQLLNVFLWGVGLWALYRLGQRSGLSDGRALGFLAASATLPLSAYTKYFMPESMFFSMFCFAAWALFSGALGRTRGPLFAAGALMGAMYFVKPHAAPLIAGTVVFVLLLPDRIARLVPFLVGVGVAFGTGKVLAPTPAAQGSSLGAYQEMLDGMLAKLTTHSSFQHGLGADLVEVARGHTLIIGALFGLSALMALAVLLPSLRLRETSRPVSVEVSRLSLLVLVLSLTLVGMSIGFTVLVGEVGRVHSRYYFFLFPLALLLLFHLPSVRWTTAGRVVASAVVIAGTGALVVWGPSYSEVLLVSLISDGPEWGFAFLSRPLFAALMGGLFVTGLWSVFQPARAQWLVLVVCLVSLASGYYVTNGQKTIYRGPLTTGREAISVETYLGRPAMYRALLVGENRDSMSKFLFFLSTAPFAEQLPGGTDLTELLANRPEVSSLILLSDAYVLPPGLECQLRIEGVRVCRR